MSHWAGPRNEEKQGRKGRATSPRPIGRPRLADRGSCLCSGELLRHGLVATADQTQEELHGKTLLNAIALCGAADTSGVRVFGNPRKSLRFRETPRQRGMISMLVFLSRGASSSDASRLTCYPEDVMDTNATNRDTAPTSESAEEHISCLQYRHNRLDSDQEKPHRLPHWRRHNPGNLA